MYRLGLIGHPVSHSKSPDIHHYFLSQLQLTGEYALYDVHEDQLESKVSECLNQNFDGFNVTVPYKELIIPLLDELDDSAKKLMAVNTVKREKDKLIGYNTDGMGYIESLTQAYPDFFENLSSRKILILGAGGAARGIYFTLQKFTPARVDLANRTISRADDICKGFNNSNAFSLIEAEEKLGEYDLVIQTTNIGMVPIDNEQIISLNHLKNNAIVSDIVYKPKMTMFLKQAEQAGARLLFGDSMLWYQAAKSFEIWTGYNVNHIKRIHV